MGRKTVTFDSLNLDLALDNLDTFDAKGIDTEEFYCPDLDANDFRIDGVDDDDAAIWDDSRYVKPRHGADPQQPYQVRERRAPCQRHANAPEGRTMGCADGRSLHRR